MIITKLMGGLGNQMFQYATGRRAAHLKNTELKMDMSWFKNPGRAIKRDYFLNVFNLEENFASIEDINKLTYKNQNLFGYLRRKISDFPKPYYRKSYVKQKYFHFDPNILRISKDTYLEGSWQSERYFKDIENIIRKDFTFKNKPNEKNRKIIEKIIKCPSISIHIRHGDYIDDKGTNTFHGICSLDYYYNASSMLIKKIRNPHFFVFSDNPKWCKINLRLRYKTTIIDHNLKKQDYEDMRLMSSCKHNIIANSTFSWWAAWLNNNPNKIVVAPSSWFKNKTYDAKDVLPKSWIKCKN